MKTNHNKFGWLVAGSLASAICLVLLGLAFLLALSGCYTEKKAVRQVGKAKAYYPSVTADFCARTYPIAEFVRDSFIYLQGEPELIIDTLTQSDTVEHYVTRYITKTVKVTDTVYKSRENAQESTAKLEALKLKYEKEIKELRAKLEKMTVSAQKYLTQRNISAVALGILASYTLLRWVIKWFTKGRLNLP